MGRCAGGNVECSVSSHSKQAIEAAIGRMEKTHDKHIRLYDPAGVSCSYSSCLPLLPSTPCLLTVLLSCVSAQGVDNSRRLTGLHETAHIDQFFWGVAHRGASIRVTRGVAQGKERGRREPVREGRGYRHEVIPALGSWALLSVCVALITHTHKHTHSG